MSSIKRIIAEESDAPRAAARRPQRAPMQIAPPEPRAEPDEVLELSEPMPAPPTPVMRPVERAAAAEPAPSPQPEPPRTPDPIVSHQAAAASRGSLDALTRLVVKPEDPASDNTLEGLVRDMLRPMLRDWLDARLPEMVEAMVAREIERITGSR